MRAILFVVLAASAVFVLWSSSLLPEQVASHFGISGRADGFMSRAAFTSVMLAAVTGLPALTWALQVWAARRKMWNIPNRAQWFNARHYAGTVRFLENHASWFSVALVAFMSTVHWLVVQANASSHGLARLDNKVFTAALAAFFVFVALWVATLRVHFRSAP